MLSDILPTSFDSAFDQSLGACKVFCNTAAEKALKVIINGT
jgi:hypothetical protein